MFQGFSQQTLDFLWNIRFNNEKSWFEAHREEFKAVLAQPMNALASDVFAAFAGKFPDLGLSLHVSRIYRDARRLHGQGPYKDHLWFTLYHGDEECADSPVFWFEIGPEIWSYGLGYYLAKPLTMAKHRARIDSDPRPLLALTDELAGQTEFALEGDSYARPKGDPGERLFAWYNKKSFALIHEERSGKALFTPELTARITDGFTFLVPCYRYFGTLGGDPAPRER